MDDQLNISKLWDCIETFASGKWTKLASAAGIKRSTFKSWLDGKQEIPVKALRALRKWSSSRPAVRLVKRPTGTGGIADATSE